MSNEVRGRRPLTFRQYQLVRSIKKKQQRYSLNVGGILVSVAAILGGAIGNVLMII